MILAPGVGTSVVASVLAGGPAGLAGRRGAPLRVREGHYRYEDEGSERRALGSVAVSAGAWWSVALSVPADEAGAREDTVLVRCERHGAASAEYRGGLVELLLPRSEVGAIATLLAGVVDQARRDGMLPG